MRESRFLLLCWNNQGLDVRQIDQIPDCVQLPNGVVLEDACPESNEAYFTGFVDYLRRAGEVVGVRFTPFGDYEFLAEKQSGQLFLDVEGSGGLLIFWSKDKSFEFKKSGDQEFGDNKLFRNDDAGYRALTIRMIPEIDFDNVELGEYVKVET